MPDQVPSSSVSVWPSAGVPDSVGTAVLAGGSGMTAAVGAEMAVALPATLVAVTSTRMEWPMSLPVRT